MRSFAVVECAAVGASLVPTALLLGVLALPCTAHAAGELDPTFDGDGIVLTDFGSFETARDVAIQADGKIVARLAKSLATSRSRATTPTAASTRPSMAMAGW